ncbi:uncharacterized protein CcaverHIS019_0110640 [Cutaneotrichosporon cavernicola]|uniref:Rhodanese domain-containing protein n=1 Tax=Cutaneotrichosporon cavernicola TaxID=279322 RepID=A0AA48HZH7_9TREE|nr:uncharacterized protein CcaverHIS019_0110640 [Cutaneotrichosporon cavernicola]BEI88346.1 hypothetical protein CcaverHIS019_0110640 [Cutaneotrichosporon cavernicola]BEI96119.1 hypothetical protein CcaverHIS631_0110680 [Cutaneotrichosporon cavernicola]BEJ03891.1 hypothetical protein CcaverHIS641_0110660 [Cutaneotrichosporon cavernicola]
MAQQDEHEWPLSLDEYARYGRQMIMPEWGLDGQLAVRKARVAVVGAGGLGCPALQYIIGAGVGEVTIIDHDTVSASNLHRQVLHTTERVGMNKTLSACIALKAINPHPTLNPVTEPLTPANALTILRDHDLVLDCTDRPYTRYLINDACVRLSLPLVSGAALGAAGQWAVYGGSYDDTKRACYRCLWPKPGPSGRCDEAGVWGPVTGMVGSGMAAEALRLLASGGGGKGSLHILHLGGSPMVRTVGMRPRSAKCVACGPNATVTDDLDSHDYVALCGETPAVPEVPDRMSVGDLRAVVGSPEVVVIDTRPPHEYGICSLPHTMNIPLASILASRADVPPGRAIFLCRRGNDSQVAAAAFRQSGREATDVRGGLVAWSHEIDPHFPLY